MIFEEKRNKMTYMLLQNIGYIQYTGLECKSKGVSCVGWLKLIQTYLKV